MTPTSHLNHEAHYKSIKTWKLITKDIEPEVSCVNV